MTRHLVALALLAVGCQKGAEADSAYCDDTTTTLEMTEASPLGFSGQDVADLATTGAPWAEALTWVRGGAATLTIGFGAPTASRFVAAEPHYPDSGIDIGIECPDRVEVDIPATFATDDGAFAEAWDVTLARDEDVDPAEASLFVEADPFGLTGTYDPTLDMDETEYDTATLFVSASFTGTATTGDVTLQVTGQEECADGDDCTAWAAEHDVASWGATTR